MSDRPVVAEALVGVEAPAWLRAWAGIKMDAKEGLLDNSVFFRQRERWRESKNESIYFITRKTTATLYTHKAIQTKGSVKA